MTMTTITANAFTAFTPQPSAAMRASGAEFILAAGIMGRALNPLGAGARAFGMLPSLWSVSTQFAAAAEPAQQWTATTGADGRASIDLGDGYSLQLNENNSEITILNANTGETTTIWGDPHVEVDGQHAFDFAGTTTFTLGNGTKITIGTEQFGGNPDAYVASSLTITRGDQAIVVNGISQNQLGDLSIAIGTDGALLDAVTRDGYVLEENQNGAGWLSTFTGEVATQADMNDTMVGGAYGPGSTMPSLQELGQALSSFLLFGAVMGVMADASARGGERGSLTAAFALSAF
jgi:hypothetical protein